MTRRKRPFAGEDLAARVRANLDRRLVDQGVRERRLAKAAQLDPADWQARHKFEGEPGPAIEDNARQVLDSDDHLAAPKALRVDTVGRLLRAGLIDKLAADGAREFEEAFHLAGLEGLKAAGLELMSKGGGAQDLPKVIMAKERIWLATKAMGGLGSPICVAAWDVLGNQLTIKQFAGRVQFGRSRSLNIMTAQGLVIGAVWCLAGHFRKHG